jgi:hypothetical protein
MMKKTLAVLGVAVAVAVASPAAASDKPYFREVKGRIELARASLAPQGWKLDQVFTGSLTQGSAGRATLQLEPGREYRVVGRCDDDCEGIDLVLARDDQPIVRDLDHDKVPSVAFQPKATGNYSAITRMVECTEQTCRYGLAVFSR